MNYPDWVGLVLRWYSINLTLKLPARATSHNAGSPQLGGYNDEIVLQSARRQGEFERFQGSLVVQRKATFCMSESFSDYYTEVPEIVVQIGENVATCEMTSVDYPSINLDKRYWPFTKYVLNTGGTGRLPLHPLPNWD